MIVTVKLGIWQVVWLIIAFMNLGMALAWHGEPKDGSYNFWVTLITEAIVASILYLGGFFG